jgi:hypothetical protein
MPRACSTTSVVKSPLLLAMSFLFAGLVSYAGVIVDGTGDRKLHVGGGSDGAGVLPYVGPASTHAGAVETLLVPTLGQVVDAQRVGVVGALVVVTHPAVGLVGWAFTDDEGFFVVDLPEFPDLELALPGESVAGIEVVAGEPVLIVLP